MSLPQQFDCAETFRRLADYLDRELPPEEIMRIEEHLAVCVLCATEFQFEERLLAELKLKAQESRMPESIRAQVLRALDQAKRE